MAHGSTACNIRNHTAVLQWWWQILHYMMVVVVESCYVQCLCLSQAFKADRNHDNPLAKRDASYASPKEVWKFISDLGISRVSVVCVCAHTHM